MIAPAGSRPRPLAELTPLLVELGQWKRLRRAGDDGSLAELAFVRAWRSLVAGARAREVALAETGAAVAGCRLGPLDATALRRCGVTADVALRTLRAGFDEVAGELEPELAAALREALGHEGALGDAPPFVAALAAQPRAGATCPGKARLVLLPPESHADHCMTVAVYGALYAPCYGADPTDAFLLGLAHHVHNAALPDAGFTGEMLLGDALAPLVERLTREALATLPHPLATRLAALREHLAHADTPLARAFHTADVVDRVLQMRWYAEAASFEVGRALEDLQLVHAGAVQAFHLDALEAARLW